jgi:hypothetical protein
MDDAGEATGCDERFDLCVIADVNYFKWDINNVLCAKVSNAGFKALIERIEKYDIFARFDKEVSDMCADIPGATCN